MTGASKAVAVDYEALCAERGEALTLRFAGDDRHIDLMLTGATVGRLDYQWRMGRRGLWVLPLRSDEADAAQAATDGADFLQGAPGGLILRVVGFGDDLEYRLNGRLGFSQCDEDTAAAGPSGAAGTAGGVDFDRADGAVCEANPAGEVEVVGRQANLSCSVMRAGVDAESGPGETAAPAERSDGPGPAALIERIIRASEFEALAEIRDRLLGVLKAPQQLLGVHVEVVAGAAPKCRLSLQLSDAGRGLAAALGDGTGDVERLVVEKALGHPDLSCGLQPGDDAESGAGETSLPAERGGVA